MKNILSVLVLGLCLTAVAKAADPAPEYNLVCKSAYDVVSGEDQMSVRGPTLTALIAADATNGTMASGTKDKTRWGVGYSAMYTSRTGKVTISITTERGVTAKTVSMISNEVEAAISVSLDSPSSSKDQTTLSVTCTIVKK
ncbi:MAG: hypothetical protein HY074_16680 [Deltaproteobacteria bacterium]|nr:hypothetical protein [Deltaproteobacteria bacterium]